MAVNMEAMNALEEKETFVLFEIIETHLTVQKEKIKAIEEAKEKASKKREMMKNKNNRFKR